MQMWCLNLMMRAVIQLVNLNFLAALVTYLSGILPTYAPWCDTCAEVCGCRAWSVA